MNKIIVKLKQCSKIVVHITNFPHIVSLTFKSKFIASAIIKTRNKLRTLFKTSLKTNAKIKPKTKLRVKFITNGVCKATSKIRNKIKLAVKIKSNHINTSKIACRIKQRFYKQTLICKTTAKAKLSCAIFRRIDEVNDLTLETVNDWTIQTFIIKQEM